LAAQVKPFTVEYTFLVDALVGMSAEVIALGLE
jgi:hypothetical protein